MTQTTIQGRETLNHNELELFIRGKENNNFQQLMALHLNTKAADFVKTSKIDGSINPYWVHFKNKAVIKDQTKRVPLLTDYQRRVRNNSVKEGKEADFIAEAPKGKKHISKCLYTDLATETKRYIAFEYFDEIKDQYPTYWIGGIEIPFENLRNWHNPSEQKAEQNGNERKVNIFAPLFDSIVSIKDSGILYTIVHPTIVEIV